MKFIHIADLHLGMNPDAGSSWSETRGRELFETLDQVLLTVEMEKIDLLLISGDLFHRQPLVRELRELNYKFSKLTSAKVVLIAGNHDALIKGSPYLTFDFSDNVIFLKDEEVTSVRLADIDTTVYGLSYHSKEIVEPLYDEQKPEGAGYHILLAHGGDAKHIPIDFHKLKWSGFDYIALGHIHIPQVIEDDLIAYPGSLEPLDRTETGRHGYMLGEINNDHQRAVFMPFNKRSYIDLTVDTSGKNSNQEMMEYIQDEINMLGDYNYFNLIVTGNNPLNWDLDFYGLTLQYQITKITKLLTDDYNIDNLYEANSNNILGRFIFKLHREDATDLEKMALDYGIAAILKARENNI